MRRESRHPSQISTANGGRPPEAPSERPLYSQVREHLVERIGRNEWVGGQRLPNEPDLAVQYGVSTATVRKAIHELQARNLIVRRRGDGTYVTSSEHRDLFYFWRIVDRHGRRDLPSSQVLTCVVAKPTSAEASRLDIPRTERVIRIERVRFLAKRPEILERIVVPQWLFPGLTRRDEIPNALYRHYEQAYGVNIARAVEDLSAIKAGKREAELLNVARGSPLLQVDRTAFGFDSRPIEWRLSRCSNRRCVYRNEVT